VLKPTYSKVAGVRSKVLPDLENGFRINCSFKSYGGTRNTEKSVDGVISIEDTVYIETWYRPDITSDCVLALPDTGAKYEILGEPENIDRRNQYLKFIVRRIKGGA
jgi:hypothetical protein